MRARMRPGVMADCRYVGFIILVFFLGGGMQQAHSGEIVPELRDQNKVFLTVGNTDFLIPAPYLNRLEVKFKPGYMGKIKAFQLFALLPNMEHITPENKAQFDIRGHGNNIEIGIDERRYSVLEKVENYARFNKQDIDLDSLKEPGLHELPVAPFQKGRTAKYLFNSSDLGLALISCGLPSAVPSPGCQLDCEFWEGIEIDADFSATYLPQRYDLMLNIRALLDGFIADAKAVSIHAPVKGRLKHPRQGHTSP